VSDPLPPLGASAMSFREATGYASGAVTWSNTARLEWQADPADPTNGVDDDKDGLVDEGQLVLRIDYGLSSERRVVLATRVPRYLEGETGGNGVDDNANGLVDEQGFSISRSGRTLTLRLTLARVARGGTVVQRTVTGTIALRS
jgi:hypothetical protein